MSEFWFEDEQLYMEEIEVFGAPPCGDEPAIYEVRRLPSGNLSLTAIADDCALQLYSTEGELAPIR